MERSLSYSTRQSTVEIVVLNNKLIGEITELNDAEFHQVRSLDLNLKDRLFGEDNSLPQNAVRKIRKIENLSLVPNVQYLSLSHNAINRIEGLDQLTGLLELNLAENGIKNIENLYSLRLLTKLNLSGNAISRIPASISHLKNLTHFRIARNILHVLNDLDHLHNLPKLVDLVAEDNPFCADSRGDLAYEDYAVLQIDSLQQLDREEVTRDDHSRVRRQYSGLRRSTEGAAQTTAAHLRTSRSVVGDDDQPSTHLPSPTPQGSDHPYLHQRSPITPPDANDTRSAGSLAALEFTPVRTSNPVSPGAAASATKALTGMQQRMETLTAKLMATDREKEALLLEVRALKTASAGAEERHEQQLAALRSELQQAHHQLQAVSSSDEQSKRDLAVVSADLQDSRLEVQRSVALHEALRRELESEQVKLRESEEEAQQLRVKLSSQGAHLAESVLASSRASVGGDFSAYEARSELAATRVESNQRQLLCDRLQSELDSVTKKWLASNEVITECRDEIARQKDRLVSAEQEGRALQLRNAELLRADVTASAQLSQLTESKAAADEERAHFKARCELLEADMDAYLRAAKKQTVASPSRYGRQATSSLKQHILQQHTVDHPGGRQSHSHYLEVASTDSEDGADPATAADSARDPHGLSATYVPPDRLSLSSLEKAAAEIMGHMLLEEIRNCGAGERVARDFDDGSGLKEACARAAIRLVHASINVSNDEAAAAGSEADFDQPDRDTLFTPTANGSLSRALYRSGGENKRTRRSAVDIPASPFHLMGNRKYLSRLVAQTQAGIAAIEDSNSLKKEIEQLKVRLPAADHACDLGKLTFYQQRIVREQEIRGETMQQEIASKQELLAKLKNHCEEARRCDLSLPICVISLFIFRPQPSKPDSGGTGGALEETAGRARRHRPD